MSNIENLEGVEVKKIVKKEKDAEYCDFHFKTELPQTLLNKLGFRLYKHQCQALSYLYEGKNVIVTTPTASGKSEIFRLYSLDNLDKTFIFIFPTRALVRDQLEKFKERLKLINIDIPIFEFTGDIHPALRRKFMKQGKGIIFTTPDVLHSFVLPYHREFSDFLSKVGLVVIDELHYYRGILGTSLYYLYKRLRKILEIYGANYKLLTLSATLEKPKEFAENLFEAKFEAVTKDYSKQPRKTYYMVDPQGKDIYELLRKIIELELREDRQVLVFLETKREVEKALVKIKVGAAYKGTLTKEVRKEIERKFKEGEIKVLFSTNALELGIDIGNIDTVINVGFPPDGMFSLLQRFGRMGRQKEGRGILILKDNALDRFYKENFEVFKKKLLNNEVGIIPINKENPYIAEKHLLLMLNELGQISEKELTDFEKSVMEKLKKEGKITQMYTLTKGRVYLPKEKVKPKTSFRNLDGEEYILALEEDLAYDSYSFVG